MKTQKMKLNDLASNRISDRELKEIKGRGSDLCLCGCRYSPKGGSSNAANGSANKSGNLHSPGGGSVY